MIYLKDQNVRMRVYRVEEKEKFLNFSGSTYEKDRNDDKKFINSYWNVTLVGHAFQHFKGKLKDGDTISMQNFKVTNESYTGKDGKKRTSVQVVVYEAAEFGSGNKSGGATKAKQSEDSDDKLPF